MFLEVLGFLVLYYWVIYISAWLLLDCNFSLFYRARLKPSVTQLRGKVVWVTGASSGIGRALALCLARHGVKLVISARRKPLLDELHTECIAQSGGKLQAKDVLVLPMDMLEIDAHERHFNAVIKYFGGLDVLVNNAGRSQRAKWEDITLAVDRELFELDVFSVLNLSRLAVRYFQQHRGGRGHLAVTSSVAGLCVVPMSASYCAAKSALNAYMNALRIEQPNMNVTIFAPGPIATDFLEEAFTGESGVKVGQSTKNQKRMTAERCGHLFAVALAHKLDLCWCGLFPVNFLAYSVHYPIMIRILQRLLKNNTLNKIREGKI